MKRLNAQKKLTPEQALFFASRRPSEELYDLQNDPHEVKNLAGHPEFGDRLIEMRQILDAWMEKSGDQGGIPEDPAVVEFYLERMKKNYDKRIKTLYKEENMSLELFK